MSTVVRVEAIGIDSPYLEAVKRLGDAYNDTLGFFPEGAFDDAAHRGRIIAAISEDQQCVGYILFRLAKDRASITHLCVDEPSRRGGVASALVQALIVRTRLFRGIMLKCRPDFPAHRLWPKFGFVQQGQVPGRGKDCKPLTVWWRDNGHKDLFSEADATTERGICGAIDANVLYDLIDDGNARPQGEESRALLADWIQGLVELVITDEIFNEIERGDPTNRQEQERKAKQFKRLTCPQDNVDALRDELRPRFPTLMTERDWSDLHQLARAIGGGAAYFVTRDTRLLDLFDFVQERYGLLVLSPTQLIRSLDEVRHATEYQPLRLAESQLTIKRLGSKDEGLLEAFRKDEPKRDFYHRVRGLLCNAQKTDFMVVMNGSDLIATIAFEVGTGICRIPMLRVRRSPVASTVFRQLLRQALVWSHRQRCETVEFLDQSLEEYGPDALDEFGFGKLEDHWTKFSIFGVRTAKEVGESLIARANMVAGLGEWGRMFTDSSNLTDVEWAFEQERYLWPVKIVGTPLNNYIVAIEPRWAEQLFDEGLARQNLFGRSETLAMNTEGVYYRSSRFPVLAPGRILWYVSENSEFEGAKAIRACSRLNRVTVGLPKDLYRENKRLGVFGWPEVFETARESIENEIMALKFSGTELFQRPIPWKEFQAIFTEEGVMSTIQSPTRISDQLFTRLYRLGTGEQ